MPTKPDAPGEEERRLCQRHALRIEGTLSCARGEWQAHLINISGNGALVAILQEHRLVKYDEVKLALNLANGELLSLQASVSHTHKHYIGLYFGTLDAAKQKILDELLSSTWR